jgi:tryptophan synthase alpha chain
MNELVRLAKTYKEQNRKTFVACLTAGYPSLGATLELSKVLEGSGADVLELCVPFSDPVADGPTIQYSSDIALKKGANLRNAITLADKIKAKLGVPVVFMSYLNPIYSLGLEKAFVMMKGIADGLIIPDAVPEETSKFEEIANNNDISLVPLVAPNTPEDRMKYIGSKSTSFTYVVSLAGVTGERKNLTDGIKNYLLLTKKQISSPRYLGFGISKPEHAKAVRKYVDGVIVASAIIKIVRDSKSTGDMNRRVAGFVRSIRKALD